MTDCWYIPETVEDQRAENRLTPNQNGSYEILAEAGLFYRHYDPTTVSDDIDGFIKPILAKLNYHSFDVVQLSPAALGEEKFNALAKQHFEEHLHEDDEARLILDGQGYFDIRDKNDKWIRILSRPGDCLIVPAGIYHRFTTDQTKYIKTLRLFKEAPSWIAINRGADAESKESRQRYLKTLHGPMQTAVGAADNFSIFGIRYPSQLDADLTRVAKQLLERHSSAQTIAVLLYITGSNDPSTGQSWCPDCVDAKLPVQKKFAALRQIYGDGAIFVECPVERAAYLGNPAYLYRTHPSLLVKGVPTILLLTARPHAKEKVDAQWYNLLEVKGRAGDAADVEALSL